MRDDKRPYVKSHKKASKRFLVLAEVLVMLIELGITPSNRAEIFLPAYVQAKDSDSPDDEGSDGEDNEPEATEEDSGEEEGSGQEGDDSGESGEEDNVSDGEDTGDDGNGEEGGDDQGNDDQSEPESGDGENGAGEDENNDPDQGGSDENVDGGQNEGEENTEEENGGDNQGGENQDGENQDGENQDGENQEGENPEGNEPEEENPEEENPEENPEEENTEEKTDEDNSNEENGEEENKNGEEVNPGEDKEEEEKEENPEEENSEEDDKEKTEEEEEEKEKTEEETEEDKDKTKEEEDDKEKTEEETEEDKEKTKEEEEKEKEEEETDKEKTKEEEEEEEKDKGKTKGDKEKEKDKEKDKEKEEIKKKKEKEKTEVKKKKEKKEEKIIEGSLTSDNDLLTIYFDEDAEIPEGAEVYAYEISSGDDYDSYVNTALDSAGLSSDDVAGVKVLDIYIEKDDDGVDAKDDIDVEINAHELFGDGVLYSDDEVVTVHIDDGDGDVLDTDVYTEDDSESEESATYKADSIYFTTGSLSPFVFIQLLDEKTVSAYGEDGSRITASYDNNCGIPAGTHLTVSSSSHGEDELDGLEEKCTDLFSQDDYSLESMRSYDINIEDMGSGERCQSGRDIDLTIELPGDSVIDGAEVSLLRFGDETQAIDASVDGDTISLGTDSLGEFHVAQFARKLTLTAGDGSTYLVTISFDSVSGIPEDAVLSVSEITDGDDYDEYVEKSEEEVGDTPGTVKESRAFDISFINPDSGEEYQPTKGIEVSIELLDDDLEDCESLDVVHIHGDDAEQTEIVDSEVTEGTIEFETEGFSVFVVVKTVKATTLTASDGEEYLITVNYDSKSGIPANAKLVASEIREGDDGYQEYVSKSADAIGQKPEYLEMARAFDISLINPRTGEEYQPSGDVSVSIRLLKDDLDAYDIIDVVHIPDGEESGIVVDSSSDGEEVKFDTDGFSVYVLTGSTYLGTYHFLSYNSFGDYQGYPFYDDQGNQVNAQVIKNGEKLTAPNDAPVNPNDPGAEFKGWFLGDQNTENPDFGDNPKPFDFDTPQNIDESETFYLYAVFGKYVHITFHSQNDGENDPILEVMRVELVSEQAEVDISNVKTTYYSQDSSKYEFYGWSLNPHHTPGSGTDAVIDNPEAYTVSSDIDLYPVFIQVHYLTFSSGPSGSGATYFPPQAIPSGEALEQTTISDDLIPDRPGYDFTGWFLSVTPSDADPYGTGTQLTEADGTLMSVDDISLGIQTNTAFGKLFLSKDATIYAGWQARTDVKYSYVVWTQRAEDAAGAGTTRSWDYAETFEFNIGTSGASVTVEDDYKALNVIGNYNNAHPNDTPITTDDENPYTGYKFSEEESDTDAKKIAADGSTVFNLYYELDGAAPSEDVYDLIFDRSAKDPDGNAAGETITARDVHSGRLMAKLKVADSAFPDDPVYPDLPFNIDDDGRITLVIPGGKEFPGYEYAWYADKGHTRKLFFDKDSYDSCTDENKILYTSMPRRNLTVYCAWEKIWYLIKIDPNFGAFGPDSNGNGSTYFWKAYESDYIQEYTWVTRDYVESESGDYYYVNHDYEYDRANGTTSDRKTYYTQDASLATSLTTYKSEPGTYLYAGWYEVKEDGSEIPYDFVNPIRGNTTLKLHWRMNGTYYLEYNPDVTVDGERLKGSISDDSVLPDERGYRDQANITIGARAVAPSEYAFTGWRVRGDDSGKVYYPGSELILEGECAVAVNGKNIVYLDAVYTKIKTAKIVYDANGGTVSDSADAGYACDEAGSPISGASGKVTRDTAAGTVSLSGLVNNSQVRLASGAGFTAPASSEATLSGWNTKADGSGDHYDLDSFKAAKGPLYVDVEEPVTLYAEWQLKVYFNKNTSRYPTAEFGTGWGDEYTLDEANGEYSRVAYYNAVLSEPEGTVTVSETGFSFDFWGKTSDGDQADAYDFGKEKLTANLRLYAHFTDAIKVPYHVASTNKVDWDEWRKTDKLRITTDPFTFDTTDFTSYITPETYEYKYSYACLSNSIENISDDDSCRIVQALVDGGVVKVTLKDNTVVELTEGKDTAGREIYIVYSIENDAETLNIKYVKEGAVGTLSPIQNADGRITYNGNEFSSLNSALVSEVLNDNTVSNSQVLTLSGTALEVSQKVARDTFNAPALLDDGEDYLSLVYDTFGIMKEEGSTAFHKNDIDISGEKIYLRYYDGRKQWSTDNSDWNTFKGEILYVVYRQKGYELRITKAVTGDDTGISGDESFEVTITSNAITRTSYKVEGTGYDTIDATPATDSSTGQIKLTVKDGSDITIKGLGSSAGGYVYNIKEIHNANYTLKYRIGTGNYSEAAESGITLTLSEDTRVDLQNEPHEICRIYNAAAGEDKRFYTLNKALDYAQSAMDGQATIRMMVDYVMPDWDTLEIPANFDITLTSNSDAKRITRNPDGSTDDAMFTNSGSLKLTNIILDGSEAVSNSSMLENEGTLDVGAGTVFTQAQKPDGNGGAIYQRRGTLTVNDGAGFTANNAGNGGAVYIEDGITEIAGGTFDGNEASQNGGAIYYAGSSNVDISGGVLSGNRAENGGAVYSVGGDITISGGTINGNSSSGNGGGVYSEDGTVSVTGGTISGNTSSADGGAIFSGSGSVTVSAGTISGNSSTGGNGGAICSENGTVKITGGTLKSNSASAKNGGAVYIGSGSLEMSAGTIGGNDAADANSAVNGAAVYVNTGSGRFTAGTVKGNMATEGGAIGIGSDNARLYFSGNISVTGNKMGDADSNIYLDRDSDNVINITGLGTDSYIGIYVADSVALTRGVPGAKFANYTSDSNKIKIKNDRCSSFSVVCESATKKMYWGNAVTLEVRYQKTSYATKLPPAWESGNNYKSLTIDEYYPVMGEEGYVALSAISEDLYNSGRLSSLGLSTTAAYGGTWLEDATQFDQYMTKLAWDGEAMDWELTGHFDDGTAASKTPLEGKKIIIYFAEPAYVSIENNTEMKLTVGAMTVGGMTVINSSSEAGYGMVFAKNGAIRSALLPVEASDLILEAGKSVNLLLPGGRNMSYTLDGAFERTDGMPESVRLRTTSTNSGQAYDDVPLPLADGVFIFPTDKKTLNKAGTYQIIFGDDKEICRIRTTKNISNTESFINKTTERDSESRYEYVFGSLNQAMAFVTSYMEDSKTATATIEMLTDYLLPATDNLSVPAGYNITLTTAKYGDGTFTYTPVEKYSPKEGTTVLDERGRATISRDSENTSSMFTTVGGNQNTYLTIENLIIDGKSVAGSSDGGAVQANDCGVTVRNVDFYNIYAGNGGALYVDVNKNNLSYTNSFIVVEDSYFYKCNSKKATGSRLGGGAIHAFVRDMTITDSQFYSCDAADQAGAVFHRVDGNIDTQSIITGCTFSNCKAKAAGGLELDSKTIIVTECTFEHCVATERNGGGFNAFMTNSATPEVARNCRIVVQDCKFDDCHQTNRASGDRFGGAFRSTANYTSILNCTFTNTSGKFGGCVGISNTNAVKAEIYGCTIDGASAFDNGGAVFCSAKELIISDTCNVDADGNPILADSTAEVAGTERIGDMIIRNCSTSKSGGAVYQDRNNIAGSSFTMTGAVIQNNTATGGSGGGIYTIVNTATINGSTISSNSASVDGGGICAKRDGDGFALILDGTEVSGNHAGGLGGGIYCLSKATFRNGVVITGNRLTTSNVGNAAGAYLNRQLIVGTELAAAPAKIVVKENTTSTGVPSDLLLQKVRGQSYHTTTSVQVLCSLSDESLVRVINPKGVGEQFGTRTDTSFTGFTEGRHVFVADQGGLYGVYNRNEPDKLIWRGGSVCKLTDANGHLLYLDEACTDPAVFDRLDYRTDGNRLSPFSYLRQSNENIVLYRGPGSPVNLTTDEIQLKMLVGTFETDTYIATGSHSERKPLTITTASSTDTDGYPYTGRAGTYATIIRGYTNITNQPLINTGISLNLKNITLDGGSADKTKPKTSTADGGLINASVNGTTVSLMANSVLQNSTISNNKSGAGVFVNSGASLVIAGGAIYNCKTPEGNGGGVYKSGENGRFEFSSGIISKCSAKNGGGIWFEKGGSGFVMSGSAQITGCSATANGGGVFLRNQKTMTMTGGSITGNKAGTAGGGIYLDYHKNTRLNLSGRITISGNTSISDGKACNVQLGLGEDSENNNINEWNGIINSKGISRNSLIGIYVPGDESPGDNPELKNNTVFDRHGLKGKPFGSYEGDTNYLYCFVNDRNGLKGGLQINDNKHIYWVEIFSLAVSKTVISGEQYDLEEDFNFRVIFSLTDGGLPCYEFSSSESNQCYFTYDEAYPGKTDASGAPKAIAINHGQAEFSLRTGEGITVNNLPAEISNSHVYYRVEELLDDSRKSHYTVSTSRSTNPGEIGDLKVKGMIGENLDREDVASKYVSNAYFDNINAICKLTSTKNGGVLLYSWDSASGKLIPAVYSLLHDTEGVKGAFDVVNSIGSSGGKQMYYWNAFTNKYEAYDYSSSDTLHVEMLVEEYKLKANEAVTLSSGKTVVLTTADSDATDGFPYVGTRNSTANILRDDAGPGNENFMFTVDGALTLNKICLDGNNKSVKRGIVKVQSTGVLTVENGAVLQNSTVTLGTGTDLDKNGGAVLLNGGKMFMTGGIIKDNKTNMYGGGAIRVQNNAEVTISGGEISGNEVENADSNGGAISVKLGTLTLTGGIIKDNKLTASGKSYGGAIYAEGDSKVYLSDAEITGNKIIASASADNVGGPGISLGEDSKTKKMATLYISGNPKFGEGDKANTVILNGYESKKNGGDSVYTGNEVRQDIYISEKHDNAPVSMVISGELTGDYGSIWVWAKYPEHYKVLKSFALVDNTKVPVTEANMENVGKMFKVFRNAQDDVATGNPLTQDPKYLYGVLKSGDTQHVYWYGTEGTAYVMLVKVSASNYGVLEGRTFTVYRDKNLTSIAKGIELDNTGAEKDVELKDLKSGAGGAFFIGQMPYGTYYVKEDGVAGYFEITIDIGGVVKITDGTTTPKKTEPVKEVSIPTP